MATEVLTKCKKQCRHQDLRKVWYSTQTTQMTLQDTAQAGTALPSTCSHPVGQTPRSLAAPKRDLSWTTLITALTLKPLPAPPCNATLAQPPRTYITYAPQLSFQRAGGQNPPLTKKCIC